MGFSKLEGTFETSRSSFELIWNPDGTKSFINMMKVGSDVPQFFVMLGVKPQPQKKSGYIEQNKMHVVDRHSLNQVEPRNLR